MNKLVQKSTALFLIITLTFTIAGCSVKPGNVKPGAGEGSTGTTAEAALPEDHILGEGSGIKGVDPASWMDSDIQQWVKMTEEVPPTADYNLHVNREWMINTELPDGYASYDSITERAVEVDDAEHVVIVFLPDVRDEPPQGVSPAVVPPDVQHRVNVPPLDQPVYFGGQGGEVDVGVGEG